MLITNTNVGKKTIRMKPGVRHDLVVGRAVEAAPVVVGQRRRGEHEQQQRASRRSDGAQA